MQIHTVITGNQPGGGQPGNPLPEIFKFMFSC